MFQKNFSFLFSAEKMKSVTGKLNSEAEQKCKEWKLFANEKV